MLQMDKCHYNVKYGIGISSFISLGFAVVFFLFFAYNIGVNPDIIYIVNVVPVIFLFIGMAKHWNNKDKNILISFLYTLINMFSSTAIVFIIMIAFYVTGILYI